MSHSGEDTIDGHQHSIVHATMPVSVLHRTSSSGPLTPKSQDDNFEDGDNFEAEGSDYPVIDFLFQNVVFYINPFLDKATSSEVNRRLKMIPALAGFVLLLCCTASIF